MIGIAIALIVALGVGGTVAVADNAHPGEVLFGVDQAVEKVRISVASKEKKDELRVRFAEERVEEIEDLTKDDDDDDDSSTTIEISDSTVTEIEADVFTNETVVKIEYGDNKTVTTTNAKTKESIVAAIVAKYPSLTKAFVEKTISIEIENRASKAEDQDEGEKKELSEEDQEKVRLGIEAALNLLAALKEQPGDDTRIDEITKRLNSYLANLPTNANVKFSDEKFKIKFEDEDREGKVEIKTNTKNGKEKTDIKTEDGRIKIEIKDGELEIKTNIGDDDDSKDSDNQGLEEAEAKIFSDKTVVEVEYNDQKTTFTTTAKTEAEIVAEIVSKFPGLTSAQVSAVLEIESEDDEDQEDDKEDEDKSGEDDKDGQN